MPYNPLIDSQQEMGRRRILDFFFASTTRKIGQGGDEIDRSKKFWVPGDLVSSKNMFFSFFFSANWDFSKRMVNKVESNSSENQCVLFNWPQLDQQLQGQTWFSFLSFQSKQQQTLFFFFSKLERSSQLCYEYFPTVDYVAKCYPLQDATYEKSLDLQKKIHICAHAE